MVASCTISMFNIWPFQLTRNCRPSRLIHFQPTPLGMSQVSRIPTQPIRSLSTDCSLSSESIQSVLIKDSQSPEQSTLIEQTLRVDHAGELGANWIYRGQKWAMDTKGDKETAQQVEVMWDNERFHLQTLSILLAQHRSRPTFFYPLWQTMAFAIGAGTGLMSKEAAMACTEAVETVIGEHYDNQLRDLEPLKEACSLESMTQIIRQFRDDELEHLNTAVDEGAQKAPGHSLLSAVISGGCNLAIGICKKL
nr:ubiquinone biosynthesis monooxygenase Coq7 [Cryptococcus depauperatus CBS 7855]